MSGIPSGLITETLVRDLLSGGAGRASIKVTSSSMYPRIKEGEILSVVKVASRSLWPGDVIVFSGELFGKDQAGLVVHRLIWRDNPLGQPTCVFTKGDALDRLDLSVPIDRVVGRVETISSAQGRRNPTTVIDRVRCLVLAAGYGIRRFLRRRRSR